jgi:uncharacterized protein (TIGR02099 family)
MVLRKVGKFLLYAVAGVLSLILVLMLALKLALDRVPQYQAEIKEWIHGRIGYHVAFAHVSPAFRWYGPELYFDGLELRSTDDQRVLARAAGGRIGADLWQLLRSGKLYAGRLELDSPTIFIDRVAPDRFALAGEIQLAGGKSALPELQLDDLPAGTLAIRHGLITIRDWSPALPRLVLREVDLRLVRGAGAVTLKLTANLPASLGGVIGIDATAARDATAAGGGRLDSLAWTALARTRALAFVGWHELLPSYLTRLASGTGGFEFVARGQGPILSRADLSFEATQVQVQLADEPSVTFDQVSGAFTVIHAGDRWTLRGRHLRAVRAGLRDPDSEFDVSWRGEAGLLELRASASYLRAETLLPLAGLLPQKDLREKLQEIAPTGEWMDTEVQLTRTSAANPLSFNLRSRFRGMGFAPVGRAPGLRGLNGTLAGNQAGGRLDLETQNGMFFWPSEFAQPVPLANFKTTLYWKHTPDSLLVATPAIDIKTHDASLHGLMAWQQPADDGSPVLTLACSVEDGDVASTHLYLPKLLLPASALNWLDRALVAGHLSHADVVFRGPLRHFPFRDGTGLFLARAHLERMTLDYKDGWPMGENLAGLAEFRNEGLNVQLYGGHVGNLALASGNARFADFKTGELKFHAALSGDAGDALGYLRASPLDGAADHAFSAAEATGPMTADVDLDLPFKEFDRRHTFVRAHLQGVALNHVGSSLAATELNGDVDVDGSQVARADIHGRVLGGPFQMTARAPRNRPVTRTIMVFNGMLAGDALHAALSLPAAISIGGTTEWHGVLRLSPEPAREQSLRITGSLAGLDLNLPEPLAKPAGIPMPTSVEIDWPNGASPQVRLALGSVLRGQFTLESDANGPKLGRVAVTFGAGMGAGSEPVPYSDSQVVSTGGTIGRLDLGGWLKLYTPDKTAKPLGSLLRTAQLNVAQIDYLGLSFLDVALDLTAMETGWRIGVGGPNVQGSIFLPGGAEPGEPLKLEFERLKFIDGRGQAAAPAGASTVAQGSPLSLASVPGSGANPRAVPALGFHAADLIWGERHFGDVRATLAKLDDGVSLKELTVTAPTFSATARGEWRGKEAGIARVQGALTSSDVGATMKDLGYDAVIEAKTGKMDFDLRWLGAPSAQALSAATGRVEVELDKGQLTGLKPGAGRVLGLASLAALPRRLSLDFSDLTDKGLAFDTVRGDFDLRDGSAYTDNVVVKGPAADIGLIGRVGLKNRDYDQIVEVTGNVSSTLPLAAFVAGPVVGGAVLLFSQVFKQPLKGLARGYYRITGSWDNPTVERIKSADAAAATAEAPK